MSEFSDPFAKSLGDRRGTGLPGGVLFSYSMAHDEETTARLELRADSLSICEFQTGHENENWYGRQWSFEDGQRLIEVLRHQEATETSGSEKLYVTPGVSPEARTVTLAPADIDLKDAVTVSVTLPAYAVQRMRDALGAVSGPRPLVR